MSGPTTLRLDRLLANMGYGSRKEMQTWTSHDDLTRVSIFWQEGRTGAAHVYTEWTTLAAP